jgi:hypothetical protein
MIMILLNSELITRKRYKKDAREISRLEIKVKAEAMRIYVKGIENTKKVVYMRCCDREF